MDADGHPAVVIVRERRMVVQQILDYWRIDDEWWRERPLSRFYWQVVLEDGRSLTVFQDLLERQWWQQRY